ncbi:tRNA lysidine(34) synthetase TilS [Candidatus Peregrinibacteria bacterium CG10_big_fil_rev_8_21_14_0_10_36_19]|nr:MAG: tRNA lysidine(34) synthetase TilS [Candidatus Peregrinibacteria bacterium CG10_big_fil_rev_8_21_14_0_10_36_19]
MNIQEIKKIEKNVIETLKMFVQENDTIIAGISGGADSVFLLHILEKLNLNTIVAHINHKSRGADSKKDYTFVKNLSKNHIFESLEEDVKKIAQKNKKGFEETARKIRYIFFNKLQKKHKAKYIITAHNANDNTETIILNLARGAGLKGISGMEILNENLLRPLLNITKEEILEFLKAKKIKHREDKSNKDLKYNRNFVRHKIIPELKKLNPNLHKTIAKNSKNIREVESHLKEEALKWIKKNKSKTSETYDAKSFKTLKKALQKAVIINIYENTIGNTNNVENIHLEEVIHLIEQNVGNKKKKLNKLTFFIKANKIKVSVEK